jgi:aryl-alcohol dehydrogenase-like predicted oxidoreductase
MDVALAAVEQLRPLVPAGATMAQFALRWILMDDAVSCVIPGGRRPEQAADNVAAAALPPLSPEVMAKAAGTYDRLVRPLVHQRW